MNLSTREALLNALTPVVEKVLIDGLGTVYMKALSAEDRINYLTENQDLMKSGETADNHRMMIGILPKIIVDKAGKALLTTDDIDALLKSSAGLVEDLAKKAFDISGMTAKAVEDIKGN